MKKEEEEDIQIDYHLTVTPWREYWTILHVSFLNKVKKVDDIVDSLHMKNFHFANRQV